MALPSAFPAALQWGRQWASRQLRSGAWVRAVLAALTVTVIGRGFDLFAFTPDAKRAHALGLQTGALVGAYWAALCPSTLTALRDADDGWSAMLRSSSAGVGGLWWGAWGAQIALGIVIVGISMVSTTVFSILSDLPVSLDLPALGSAGVAVVLVGLIASAASVWWGSVAGSLVALLTFAAGQTGTDLSMRALGPAPVGQALSASDTLRTVVLAVGAVAITQAGLRRLRR